MPTASKRVRANEKMVGDRVDFTLAEAIDLLQKTQAAKFDETVELVVRLGIDVKKSDQMVRGAVSLPHGIGKSMRVIAFARGDKAEAAKAAGAMEVGADELAKKIQDGWLDFDVVVASPDMMGVVGRLGRVLGPQGKMPSPKSGTVTPDVAKAVQEFTAGKVTVRADAGGNVHAPVGKRSFPAAKLVENVEAMVAYLKTLKPSASKGHYILGCTITTTMGPGLAVQGL